MDSLTQIVLGAAVGEAVLGKKVGNKAMLWGAIAGTIPDLDVFIKLFTDPITSTELHRGISHSLFFSIVMAPILGWFVTKYQKFTLAVITIVVFGLMAVSAKFVVLQVSIPLFVLLILGLIYKVKIKTEATRKGWSWLFFWTLVTHPLLDAHTTWGTQFFWPFDYRLAYKNIFVVDPLYTIPFLSFVIIALCYKRMNPKRTRFNNIGLIVSTTYMALTFVLKGISFGKFEKALEKENISYIEMDTHPTPLNTILWNAQIETITGYKTGYYSFFDSKEITFSPELTKNHHLLEPYKEQKVIKQLKKIAAGWYLIDQVNQDTLLFTDIRFGQFGFDDESPFFWKYKLWMNKQGIMEAKKVQMPDDINLGKIFGGLGDRIAGN